VSRYSEYIQCYGVVGSSIYRYIWQKNILWGVGYDRTRRYSTSLHTFKSCEVDHLLSYLNWAKDRQSPEPLTKMKKTRNRNADHGPDPGGKEERLFPFFGLCLCCCIISERFILLTMPVYNFKKMSPVPAAPDLIDIVLMRTQRKTPTVIHPGYKITRIRSF